MAAPERLVTVIPTYREPNLFRTVEALLSQSVPPDSIVVVNNDPKETLQFDLRDDAHTPVHVIDEPSKGTGTASNTGFRYAIDELGADIVSRTDADGVPKTIGSKPSVLILKKIPVHSY